MNFYKLLWLTLWPLSINGAQIIHKPEEKKAIRVAIDNATAQAASALLLLHKRSKIKPFNYPACKKITIVTCPGLLLDAHFIDID